MKDIEHKISKLLRKHLVEAKADTGDTIPEPDVAKIVWEQGYPFLTDIFAQRYDLEAGKTSFVVPVPALLTAGDAFAAADVTFSAMTSKTIPIDKLKGLNIGWTREYLDDCAWSAMEPQLKETGRAIEEVVFGMLLAHAYADAGSKNAITWSTAAAFAYADFIKGIAHIAGHDLNCDTCILNPIEYYDLLTDVKFVDASVIGSADPITSGKIRTTLGVTVYCSSKITAGKAYFLDSKKALALGVIRDKTVEEYSYPDANLYGFVASIRFGSEVILPDAVCIMSEV